MNKKIKITLLIFLVSIGSSFGQTDFRKGFIITQERDTVSGQVDYRSNSKNYDFCIFKDEQGERKYYPDEIVGFGYADDKFFSSRIKKGSFVEALVSGKMSLYKSKSEYIIKKDTALFELESIIEEVEIEGKIRTREKSNWRGLIMYLVSDCLGSTSVQAGNIRLSEKSLTRLVVKYNKCSNEEFTEYKSSKPWTKFAFGASAGLSRSEIQVKEASSSFSYLDDSYISFDPIIGVMLMISSPRVSEKISFQSEINFIQSSYSSLVQLDRALTEYHDTSIDLSTLSIPLSIKYSFPGKKYGVYFEGGVNFDYHLSADTQLFTERVAGDVVNTLPETAAFTIKSNQIGYFGGIGILKSYQQFNAGMALRYYQMPHLNETRGFIAENNRISLNLILFRK